MKTKKAESIQEDQIQEEWTKPTIVVSSIKEETMSDGGGGPDFASELGS